MLYGITATFGMLAVVLLDSGIWKALSFAILVLALLAIGYKDIFGIRKNVHEFEKELKQEKIETHREDKS